jgi:hypothetical protein
MPTHRGRGRPSAQAYSLPVEHGLGLLRRGHRLAAAEGYFHRLLCERYFKLLSTIPMCCSRLQCWLFSLEIRPRIAAAEAAMSAVTATLRAVLASHRLRLVFGTILQVGNFMNSGTAREHADAFDMVRKARPPKPSPQR